MASGSIQARERRVPKVAEKKVKIVDPEPIDSSPRREPKVSADPSSQSWYTPVKIQSPSKSTLQRSVPNVTPRSAPSKADIGKTSSTKTNEFSLRGPMSLAKSAEDTLQPTARLVSKPLPALPIFESRSSRWTTSTGSIYSSDTLSVLNLFPNPPEDTPNALRSGDWEIVNPVSISPVLMSCPNTSSSSVATILARTAPDPPTLKHLILKAVPKPKIATVVHQNPRASCSFSQIQDSIIIQRGRANPKVPAKDNIQTSSIRKVGPALRRRSSSFGSFNRGNPLNRIVNIEALVWPHLRETPEVLERIERARMERDRQYELEQEKERELKQFEMEFGFNPYYKGRKMYEREMDTNGFELIKPDKSKQRKWL